MGISGGDESAMKSAVALIGPVSAAVDARSSSFRVSPCNLLTCLIDTGTHIQE